MPANVEIVNGEGSFVSYRRPAWHRLGKVIEMPMTVAEALVLANADYEVWKSPVYAYVQVEGKAKAVRLEDRRATTRFNPATGEPQILGDVGKDYGIVLNRDAFALADYIASESDDGDDRGRARVETLGVLDEGKRAFCSIKMPGDFVLDPNGAADKVESYALITNSFDGSVAINLFDTDVRTVCQNTLSLAMNTGFRAFRIKHTRHVEARLELARKVLDSHFAHRAEVKKLAEQMIAQACTDAEFDRLTKAIFPVRADATERQRRNDDEARGTLHYLFAEGPSNENIRGTRWAAFNAVTEYLDWYRNMKVADVNVAADRRAMATLFTPQVQSIRQKAIKVLTTV